MKHFEKKVGRKQGLQVYVRLTKAGYKALKVPEVSQEKE